MWGERRYGGEGVRDGECHRQTGLRMSGHLDLGAAQQDVSTSSQSGILLLYIIFPHRVFVLHYIIDYHLAQLNVEKNLGK